MKLALGVLALTGLLLPARGDITIDLGFVSFDSVIPGAPGSPGVNGFSVNNLTGDPLLAGFALPPDFPSLTFATFQNATLVVNGPSPQTVMSQTVTLPQTFMLGDLAPGFYASTDLGTEFPDSELFTSATFTATLSPLNLLVPGGTFIATSPNITATILPSSGTYLTAGVDFGLITVSGQPATTPEPASLLLLIPIIVFCLWRWNTTHMRVIPGASKR